MAKTYMLFKAQAMPLSAITSRKEQIDADWHAGQNPEHALVSNKQKRLARRWLTFWSKSEQVLVRKQEEGLARCWLTTCSKPRGCSHQKQGVWASQMLTYILFKTQSMLLSATNTKGYQDADLHAVQNPKHALVSNKQEEPARHWFTNCSKPRTCSCQQQARRDSQRLTYILVKWQIKLISARSMKGQ